MLQVPRLVLAACGKLLAIGTPLAAKAALCMSGLLLTPSAEGLPQAAAGPAGSNGSSSSSSSELSAMLWEQIEQSGFLLQLPPTLSLLAAGMTAGPFDASVPLRQHAINLANILKVLRQLQPSFLTVHAAGQQCLAPTMQLGLSSLHYISIALAQAGRQEGMERCLRRCWDAASFAACAAVDLLEQGRPGDQHAGGAGTNSGSSSSSSSSSSQRAAALAVLQAEQLAQWLSMNAVVAMLAHWVFLQQEAPTNAAMSNSISITSNSNSSLAASRAHSRQPAVDSMSEEQWLPAALAPSMPAAYSSMLEQLGCSREVGLWVASFLYSPGSEQDPTKLHERGMSGWLESNVAGGLSVYAELLLAMSLDSNQSPALHMAMAAASLQWLASMPPGMLLTLHKNFDAVPQVAASACKYGRLLLQKPSVLQQTAGDVSLSWTTSQTVMQLSADVLEKVLVMCSGLHVGRVDGTLLKFCKHVVAVLAEATTTAAQLEKHTATTLSQQDGTEPVLQLPFNGKCCKLLQGYVRLAGAAAAAGPARVSKQCATSDML
jgi:hypothetical protein